MHDKVEYMVAIFDNEEKDVRLSLRQTEILAKLQSIVSDIASDRGETSVSSPLLLCRQPYMRSLPCRHSVPTFHPEYGRFMLESTPGSPYTGEIRDLLSVEGNMRYR